MLAELVVRDLGVIEHVSIVFGPGMTVLSGETGAGKTLLVEGIELLLGSRADPTLVRPGAAEARVDGRFVMGDSELVLSRVVPTTGRSRAYTDGAPVSAQTMGEIGRNLLDLHGQHAHQTLLSVATQREMLDEFASVDLAGLRSAQRTLATIDEHLRSLGGDDRARAREIDLLRFQVTELEQARIAGADEDERLEEEADLLADALGHRESATAAVSALTGEGGARDAIGHAIAAVQHRRPFSDLSGRLRGLLGEIDDVARDVRSIEESIEDDPERLAEIGARRRLLRDLCRKYGDDLTAVMQFEADSQARLEQLVSRDARAEQLDDDRRRALESLRMEAANVRVTREAGAPLLAEAIQKGLRGLAMQRARVEIRVGPGELGDGSDVAFLLTANPGAEPLPLTKVASGGELARAMLATRLAMLPASTRRSGRSEAAMEETCDSARWPGRDPETLVFDEVDAGIGGAAATAVGRALAQLGQRRQVLVVTHLAQVAAFASSHVLVAKSVRRGKSVTTARTLGADERVTELGRMLSGQPESATARRHAEELLDLAKRRSR